MLPRLSIFLSAALLSALLWTNCTKPTTEFTPKNNPFEVVPARFRQKVLIESFVAEWTSSSLQAALKTSAITTEYPDEVFTVNLHVNDWLSIPFHEHLSDLLGGLIDVPRAAINRIPNTAKDSYTLLPIGEWTNGINQALKTASSLALAIETGFTTSKTGFANVYIAHKEAISGNIRLFLYITQDQIPALFQQGATDVYHHQNVLRDVLPGIGGEAVSLSEDFPDGVIVKTSFPAINLQNLDLTQLKLTAFVARMDSDFRKMRILNVQQVRFGGNKYWD